METKEQYAISKFIEHNKNNFKHSNSSDKRKPLVLFEFTKMPSAYISYSYMANVLANEGKAKIVVYSDKPKANFWKQLVTKIKSIGDYRPYDIYKSFGSTAFIDIIPTSEQKNRAKTIYDQIYPGLKTKKDIEAITINGTFVGDLFYDTFLRSYRKPTINKEQIDFQEFLLNAIGLFLCWEDFLDNNDVCAINVSHCVYTNAIPLRLAVRRNIPVYQANATYIYLLDQKHLFAYNDFHFFPEYFAALPKDIQVAGVNEAKGRLRRRFGGEVGVDMGYSTKSAYGASRHTRLLRESPRKKILIATHCFFDSPHAYGDIIFPDFYEWLDFLGKITEETDYDWYIKTHPDYRQGTMEIVESFIGKYPKFTLLPADASHHQIIADGIDFALTVHGTIGFEYAALGIPVINVSQNNPHIAYDFNLHATDTEDYRRILKELNSLDFKIDNQQIYEYYFMRHVYNTENMFFDNYERTIEELGGYSEQFTPAVYEKWMNEWNQEKHNIINSALSTFIQSGDFRMDYSHFGREFTMDSTGTKQ